MTRTDYFKMLLQVFREVAPVSTCGILTVAVGSCVLFGIQTYFSFTPGALSAGATVFQSVHLHRLLLFPFYHRTFAQLLLNITALLFLSGSLEKGVGTVRFLFLFLLMSTTTGLWYSFLDLLQEDDGPRHVEGLIPVVLASVAVTTMHTKMSKAFLCGLSFPTMALPWVFLIVTTAVIPLSVLPCNIIGILIGWVYGKGWFSRVDVSEARAGVLEKTVPFRFLRRICGARFVPASAEERRTTLRPQINPTPGSYPVQAYAPLSSINAAPTGPNSMGALSGPTPPLYPHGHGSVPGFGQSHGHSCNHSHHTHSHGGL